MRDAAFGERLLLAESGYKSTAATDQKPKNLEPCL
ncbi:hypothetical protein PS907_01166 [Pseudomonas fluorescens]|nr:hypothetical protein PS907_01166 [Pseudomonas fluorescens]